MAKLLISESNYAAYVDSNIGICLNCGVESENCEPDTRNRKCYTCNLCEVFGAEELLIMGKIEFKKEGV